MRYRFGLAVLMLVLLFTTATALAQSGGGYDLTWNTLDNGGGTSSGGLYTIDGTIGQFDASVMSGGSYTLAGGFWTSLTAVAQFKVYLPLTLK